jgi:hypothetical protein
LTFQQKKRTYFSCLVLKNNLTTQTGTAPLLNFQQKSDTIRNNNGSLKPEQKKSKEKRTKKKD